MDEGKRNEMVAGIFSKNLKDEDKRELIRKFYERHQEKPNVEYLVHEMKRALGYEGDDWK